jgi:hypothetical protein
LRGRRRAADKTSRHKMAGAKYNETYKKVSTMGEKLKAAGKQGPSNDEQLHVRFPLLPKKFRIEEGHGA